MPRRRATREVLPVRLSRRRPDEPKPSAILLGLRQGLPGPPPKRYPFVEQFQEALGVTPGSRTQRRARLRAARSAAELLGVAEGLRIATKIRAHHQRLDALWESLHADADGGLSEDARAGLVVDVDTAVYNYVVDWKPGLWEHPLVRARIETAVWTSDRRFLARIGRALTRKLAPHGNLKGDRLLVAAAVLVRGGSWHDAWDRVAELAGDQGADFPEAAEFYKRVRRSPPREKKLL